MDSLLIRGFTMLRFLFAVPLMCLGMSPVASLNANDLPGAIAAGKTSVSFRLRQEHVDDDGFARNASANTLRTRLTYTSGLLSRDGQSSDNTGLDLILDVDHVSHIGERRFNDTRNGNIVYPVVPDPKGVDLNQLALRYRSGVYTVTAGRQRIVLDNQRFIGGVAWRQNEQTFDGLRISGKPWQALQVDYSWVDSTRRIFGPSAGTPPPRLKSNHHLLNARYQFAATLVAGGYLYSLDFADAAALSSQTVGAYLAGELAKGGVSYDYRAEFARQTDNANNAFNISADYWLISAGVRLNGVRFALAREMLGADSSAGVAVQTPLATLHAFQGWTDRFLNTPGLGVQDTYVSAGGRLGSVDLLAMWHEYHSDIGNRKLGSEINLQASMNFRSNYSLMLKLADYNSSGFGTDTFKFWTMFEARF
jgi:hypothetical protein